MKQEDIEKAAVDSCVFENSITGTYPIGLSRLKLV